MKTETEHENIASEHEEKAVEVDPEVMKVVKTVPDVSSKPVKEIFPEPGPEPGPEPVEEPDEEIRYRTRSTGHS